MLQSLVDHNLQSVPWFRPELALTFGAMAVFVLDLVWRKSADGSIEAWLMAGIHRSSVAPTTPNVWPTGPDGRSDRCDAA